MLALWQYGRAGLPGEGEDVFIGVLPSETLSDAMEESLESADSVSQADPSEESFDDLAGRPRRPKPATS